MRKKVLIVEPINPLGIELLRDVADLAVARSSDPAELSQEIGDYHGAVLRLSPFPASVFEAAPRLEFIARTGVGYDNIDMAAARAHGVRVLLATGCNALSVAEHALGLMMALAKRLFLARAAVLGDAFYGAREGLGLEEISGKTVGLVGFGDIGQALARICRGGFDMRVVALVRDRARYEAAHPGVDFVTDLDQLLPRADFVSLHLPATEETRRMIGARQLARMRPTACLINTSRGSLVDEEALRSALERGVIAGAGLDVFEPEPPARDNPLLKLANCVVTPHVGGFTRESTERTMRSLAASVAKAVQGIYDGPQA